MLLATELFVLPPAAPVLEKMRKLKARRRGMKSVYYRREWFKLRKELSRTHEWAILRAQASSRAQMWCEKSCGHYGSQPHHKKTVHSRMDLVFDLNNVLWICQTCHDGVHQ